MLAAADSTRPPPPPRGHTTVAGGGSDRTSTADVTAQGQPRHKCAQDGRNRQGRIAQDESQLAHQRAFQDQAGSAGDQEAPEHRLRRPFRGSLPRFLPTRTGSGLRPRHVCATETPADVPNGTHARVNRTRSYSDGLSEVQTEWLQSSRPGSDLTQAGRVHNPAWMAPFRRVRQPDRSDGGARQKPWQVRVHQGPRLVHSCLHHRSDDNLAARSIN